jgi:hypothetical protein
MRDSIVPLLDGFPISLLDCRTSTDHFLRSASILIHHNRYSRVFLMTYRFMRYPSQSFLLLLSLVQYESDNSHDDNCDYDPNDETCEATFSDL